MPAEPNEGLFAPGSSQSDRLTFPNDGTTKGISNHETFVCGQELTGEVFGNREVKSITILAILGPFLVNFEICPTRLHFHHHNFPFLVDGGHVRPSTIGERQLEGRRVPHLHQQAHNASGHGEGHLWPCVAVINVWGTGVGQPWNSGRVTFRPSSFASMPIWQESLEVSFRSDAKSSIDSSIGEGSPVADWKPAST